mmetsp:Transcript_56/g.69  ORF Transcript_56/g.69 Transcript_56/m.69 type:complete len:234 (+) Transcript_56:246-947(+)
MDKVEKHDRVPFGRAALVLLPTVPTHDSRGHRGQSWGRPPLRLGPVRRGRLCAGGLVLRGTRSPTSRIVRGATQHVARGMGLLGGRSSMGEKRGSCAPRQPLGLRGPRCPGCVLHRCMVCSAGTRLHDASQSYWRFAALSSIRPSKCLGIAPSPVLWNFGGTSGQEYLPTSRKHRRSLGGMDLLRSASIPRRTCASLLARCSGKFADSAAPDRGAGAGVFQRGLRSVHIASVL